MKANSLIVTGARRDSQILQTIAEENPQLESSQRQGEQVKLPETRNRPPTPKFQIIAIRNDKEENEGSGDDFE